MTNDKDIRKIFGNSVTDLRTQKGLTQEQLAELLELSPHTVTRIETGKTFVSCKVIAQLCDIFGVAPNVLFTPKLHILYEEHINYKKEIIKLLPGLKEDRLKELYNFLVIMNN